MFHFFQYSLYISSLCIVYARLYTIRKCLHGYSVVATIVVTNRVFNAGRYMYYMVIWHEIMGEVCMYEVLYICMYIRGRMCKIISNWHPLFVLVFAILSGTCYIATVWKFQEFSYHLDFTWNQFWGFLKWKISHFNTFRGSEFWFSWFFNPSNFTWSQCWGF